MKKIIYLFVFFAIINTNFAQNDTLQFIDYKNPFFEEIEKSSKELIEPKETKKMTLKMDFKGKNLPKSTDEFTKVWHNDPISQGWTGNCWDYCTTSFYESEINRLYNKKIKLSETWTAYWEMVEKVKYYVKTKGKSLVSEGSQANAVKRVWKIYGVVPYDAYPGLLLGQKFPDQHKMMDEISNFLKFVKANDVWNEEFVINTVKRIMNTYLTTPPTDFQFEGKTYNAKTFLTDVVKLNLDDYVDVISILEPGYFKQVAYDVPDNWWNDSSYYNIPLDQFMNAIKESIKSGVSVVIGGDVSEAGLYSFEDVAMIPSFDIPSKYIDDKARQFRFSNGTTGDDHGIHIVGYTIKDGAWWFLIKDSGSGARNGNAKGYYYFHEDYVKLKMMVFHTHNSAIAKFLEKFNK